MSTWVTKVGTDRLPAVTVDDTLESLSDNCECLIPRDLMPLASAPHYRASEAIGVAIEILYCRTLRADVSLREDILFVAAHEGDITALHVKLKATGGLTQRAGAVLDLAHISGSIGLSEEGCGGSI
ncbi:unannotated protein [freshwater metagenome]|uniref:Unannotated protein n=1 Tax=freshwater metagenome TaxID=449393 RepID=A0A6J6KHK9_9ZZZZ